ncbi:hypothetical protein GCM10023115_42650 [Pontixanthobacter gangjinensis]|uniref:PorT family protein n=1 Tax=Christiangramia aestuarii TaxID=1028746 RepID=A0A7M3SYG2_9FLAO|nr:hypothetical protein [Christiangramia aestuarii]MUP41643.1 hypothetical protein [Christiangramia aestuarii]
MKRLSLILIILFSAFHANAQWAPKVYAGAKAFYDKGFEGNTFGGFEAGAELLRFKFLAPEIGISYFSGQPNIREFPDLGSLPPEGRAKFDGRFNSFNFSLGPKFIFGNQEAALVFLPEFNLGRMKVSERYFLRDNTRYELREEAGTSDNISFWNFSAGVEGDFFGLDRIKFSLLLTYTTLDSKKAFEDLQFPDSSEKYAGGSEGGLGINFRAYFDIFKN